MARHGDTATLAASLDAGAPTAIRTPTGHTMLMQAAHDGHVETVEMLLARGADPDTAPVDGRSLRCAAMTDHVPHPRSAIDRLVAPLRDAILDSIDPNDVVSRIDVDEVVARIHVQALLDRVDVNAVLDRVDVNDLLDRVDPDRLLDRVDPDRLLDRVDPNRLLDRVDVDQLMSRVDVDALVARVDIDGIVASSTRGAFGSLIDIVRRQLVGLDAILVRTVQRLRGVDMSTWPVGPPALVSGADRGRYDVTGRYAGPITRLVANAADVGAGFGLFTVLSAGLAYLATILLGVQLDPARQSGPQWFAPLALVFFLYTWGSISIAGKTPGMALLGIRVVRQDGHPLRTSRAFVRTLVLPFSALFFGLGFVGLVVGRERRGLHDVAAGSTVVYDWGDRPASLPTPLGDWLARHEATPGI